MPGAQAAKGTATFSDRYQTTLERKPNITTTERRQPPNVRHQARYQTSKCQRRNERFTDYRVYALKEVRALTVPSPQHKRYVLTAFVMHTQNPRNEHGISNDGTARGLNTSRNRTVFALLHAAAPVTNMLLRQTKRNAAQQEG